MTILSNYNGDIDCWRKMQFNSVKRGNFSGMAGHVNKVMDQALEAGRSTAVDNTAIAAESIKGRSLERRAAMKAEGKVAQAGLQAFAKVKDTKNKIESQKKINDIKRPAKRMAGILGGLGAITSGAVMMSQNAEDKADREELRGMRNAIDAKQDALEIERSERDDAVTAFLKNRNNGGESTVPKPSAPASNGVGAVTPKTTSTGLQASGKTSPGFKSFVDMAAKSGAKYPQLVAAQWALESGWGKTPSGKNNYFGIKAGAGEQGTSKQTWEVYGGKEVNTSARFKDFDSPQGSVNELVSRWHKDYKNYRGVNNAPDAFSAADMLTSEGYATDPNYAKKLKQIMRDQGY